MYYVGHLLFTAVCAALFCRVVFRGNRSDMIMTMVLAVVIRGVLFFATGK